MVILYQAIAISILALFLVYVSDVRKKPGMKPILPLPLIWGVRIMYPILALAYFLILLGIRHAEPFDIIGIIATATGTYLVIRAKRDLGAVHTWAGYTKEGEGARLVTEGIFATMRHPLYTGIVLFLLGGLLIAENHAPFQLFLPMALCIVAVVAFVVFSAIRESQALEAQFGDTFREYRNRVRAFLPF
jgi:protein-S-isoprenylcysteine O-methyltransferase Ste14